MLCVYNRTRTPEEIRKLLGVLPVPASEIYLETDPPRAYEVARKTSKTCFLFKILAAGRVARTPEEVDKAFKQALTTSSRRIASSWACFPASRTRSRKTATASGGF